MHMNCNLGTEGFRRFSVVVVVVVVAKFNDLLISDDNWKSGEVEFDGLGDGGFEDLRNIF